MQGKSGVKCFLFYLLVAICTAVPLPKPDSDFPSDGEMIRRQGADDAINDDEADQPINDDEADQPINEDVRDDAGANKPVTAEDKGLENKPVTAEENDIAMRPVTAEEKDLANKPVTAEDTGLGNKPIMKPVTAEEKDLANKPVTAEAGTAEEHSNENKGVADEDNDNENKAVTAEENDDKNKAVTAEENDNKNKAVTAEVTDNENVKNKDNNVKASALIADDCKSGKSNCKLEYDKINYIPGFKLSTNEQSKFKLWPDAKIPYLIDEFSYDKDLRDVIRRWLQGAHVLGLQFTELSAPPENDDQRWVFFVNRRGQLDCKDYSTNSFTNTGVQKVVIGYDCLKHEGPIAAIVMALAGVPPQHNAPDRDEYITINEEHILPNKKGFFKKLNDGDWLFHDLGYDFDSVSHYDAHKYSADGSQTIAYKEGKGDSQGSYILSPLPRDNVWTFKDDAKTYSSRDIIKVRMLYNKPGVPTAKAQLKPEECNSLFQPGPSYKITPLQKNTPIGEYPKPKKYMDAVGGNAGDTGGDSPAVPDDGGSDNKRDKKLYAIPGGDVNPEALSSLESN